MTAQEYIKDRVQDQMTWMDKKSQKNKVYYLRLKVTEVLAAATIPFLALFKKENCINCVIGECDLTPYIISLLGVLIVVLAGIQQLHKYYDHWTRYRTTSELLKREKFLFETRTAPYNEEATAFSKFVENIEGILANESKKWQDVSTKEVGK